MLINKQNRNKNESWFLGTITFECFKILVEIARHGWTFIYKINTNEHIGYHIIKYYIKFQIFKYINARISCLIKLHWIWSSPWNGLAWCKHLKIWHMNTLIDHDLRLYWPSIVFQYITRIVRLGTSVAERDNANLCPTPFHFQRSELK